MRRDENAERAFTRFVEETEPRLSHSLAAAYGIEIGTEVTADALTWAWEHWEKVRAMDNPAGYLYRVGQSKARRYHRPRKLFPALPPREVPGVDPELPSALDALSPRQRGRPWFCFTDSDTPNGRSPISSGSPAGRCALTPTGRWPGWRRCWR